LFLLRVCTANGYRRTKNRKRKKQSVTTQRAVNGHPSTVNDELKRGKRKRQAATTQRAVNGSRLLRDVGGASTSVNGQRQVKRGKRKRQAATTQRAVNGHPSTVNDELKRGKRNNQKVTIQMAVNRHLSSVNLKNETQKATLDIFLLLAAAYLYGGGPGVVVHCTEPSKCVNGPF
jgi:IS30 family transposase